MARGRVAEGAGARDLSLRFAVLALALALAAGCASKQLKVLQPLPAAASRVSLTFDPAEGVSQAEFDEMTQAISTSLLRSGVTVVSPDEGAPALVGHLSTYRPEIQLAAVWRVQARDGSTIGQCRTQYGVSLGIDAVDWGDVLHGTGEALAEFLAGP